MNRPKLVAVPDQLDAALAAAAEPPPVRLGQVDVTLSSGRAARLIVPVDLSDTEILDLLAALSNQMRQAALAARSEGAGSRILVPRSG